MSFSCKLTEKDYRALQRMGEFIDNQPNFLYIFEHYEVQMGPRDVTLRFSNGGCVELERWGNTLHEAFLRLMLHAEIEIAYHWVEVCERGAGMTDEERLKILMWVSKWHINLEAPPNSIDESMKDWENRQMNRFEFLLEYD